MASSGRSRSSMAVRAIFRATLSPSLRPSSIRSTFVPSQARISTSPFRFVRRELITLVPFHTAIASACLVSKLSSNATSIFEGRLTSYVSPI